MEPNKILSASILDLLFDDRNKEYGAYELRKTYSRRITKALVITGAVALLAFTGVALANSFKPGEEGKLLSNEVTIADISPDKPIEKLPEPKKIEEPQTRTVQFTMPVITHETPEPPPTQDDFHDAKIDIATKSGVDDIGLTEVKAIDDGKGIVEQKINKEPDIFIIVEVNAKFEGNWEKFLTKNLSPEIPVDNGAPAGQYKVLIQFVVDLEGNVSDIKALTNFGYGMEQEAIRVLKKATKWVPANQNGHPVKAYRIQPITFQVLEN